MALPKKRLLLLDIDETLCHTFKDIQSLHALKLLYDITNHELRSDCYMLDFFDEYTGKQEHMWGKRRPNLDKFLQYIFDAYDYVGVYTAADADYAKAIVRPLFREHRPHFVFDRSDCFKFTDSDGYEDHTKPLKLLFDRHPELSRLGIDLNDVDMIDNKENNFICNRKHGLVIPDYIPEPTLEGLTQDDKYLLAAIAQLKKRSLGR